MGHEESIHIALIVIIIVVVIIIIIVIIIGHLSTSGLIGPRGCSDRWFAIEL